MQSFSLRIVTPEGIQFDGEAQRLLLRSVEGEIGILASHADYMTALCPGMCRVRELSGAERLADCGGGLLSVREHAVCIAASSFRWEEN